MSNRTISVPDDADWERWVDAAWDRRVSVSKLIRDAVNAAVAAYGRGDDFQREGNESARTGGDNRGQVRSGFAGARAELRAGTLASTGGTGEARELGMGERVADDSGSPQMGKGVGGTTVGAENAAPASPAFRPFLKQDQIRKPKK